MWACHVTRDEFCQFLAGHCTYVHESGDVIEITEQLREDILEVQRVPYALIAGAPRLVLRAASAENALTGFYGSGGRI
jgi:hypothetical protein